MGYYISNRLLQLGPGPIVGAKTTAFTCLRLKVVSIGGGTNRAKLFSLGEFP